MQNQPNLMRYLDLTFADPAENLACDEALVQSCENERRGALLRVWQATQYFVVAGHSNKIGAEVDQRACAADQVRVLRRCTGGGTVLQGPGCLNYALILPHEEGQGFADLARVYSFVLERHRRVFNELTGATITMQGTSDLTVGGRKFSGNSQYRRRSWTLIHGTILLDLDFTRIERYLPMPSKEPGYRQHRPHSDFLRNLYLASEPVKHALRDAWGAIHELETLPLAAIEALARDRYSRPEWNLKFR
jgi:lipoate-protein ligase A